MGLARATDYLTAHPESAALVLALEFSSLTFQRCDRSPTNVVSTAIFGDGGAAAVLVGARHPRAGSGTRAVRDAESRFFPGTTHLMGFELRNTGLQIILDRGIAPFVRREVCPTVEAFLGARGLAREAIAHFILHPGGRRVIEAMAERLGLGPRDLAATEAVLSEHGNMSSVTILFVLDEVLRHPPPRAGIARACWARSGPASRPSSRSWSSREPGETLDFPRPGLADLRDAPPTGAARRGAPESEVQQEPARPALRQPLAGRPRAPWSAPSRRTCRAARRACSTWLRLGRRARPPGARLPRALPRRRRRT